MKDPYNDTKFDPVNEALRYVDNAKSVLKERGRLDTETNCFEDDKYVRAAGNYLWYSVLIMLDAVFNVKNRNRPHPDVNDYKDAIRTRDRKLLTLVNAAYTTMHINMGYDGNPSKTCSDAGFQLANQIIERCEKMM